MMRWRLGVLAGLLALLATVASAQQAEDMDNPPEQTEIPWWTDSKNLPADYVKTQDREVSEQISEASRSTREEAEMITRFETPRTFQELAWKDNPPATVEEQIDRVAGAEVERNTYTQQRDLAEYTEEFKYAANNPNWSNCDDNHCSIGRKDGDAYVVQTTAQAKQDFATLPARPAERSFDTLYQSNYHALVDEHEYMGESAYRSAQGNPEVAREALAEMQAGSAQSQAYQRGWDVQEMAAYNQGVREGLHGDPSKLENTSDVGRLKGREEGQAMQAQAEPEDPKRQGMAWQKLPQSGGVEDRRQTPVPAMTMVESRPTILAGLPVIVPGALEPAAGGEAALAEATSPMAKELLGAMDDYARQQDPTYQHRQSLGSFAGQME